MKVVLTGGTGFVGSYLKNVMEDMGFEISCLNLRGKKWKDFRLEPYSVMIHLAGKAHDTSNTSNCKEYFTINRDLTVELFNFFLESNLKDFFFFSSVKAVTDSVNNVLNENAVCNPLTPYGKSKLEAEQYLLSKKLPEGKRLFIIRPCMIHGPGNKGNLNLLYKIIEKGIPWPLASFNNQRSFLSIDNLCFLIISMMKNRNVSSGIYNFSDDEPLSTNQLVQIISEELDRKVKLLFVPKNIMVGFAILGGVVNSPLNLERLRKLTENYVVDNHKIKDELKIHSLPVSSQSGIRKTIKSFL